MYRWAARNVTQVRGSVRFVSGYQFIVRAAEAVAGFFTGACWMAERTFLITGATGFLGGAATVAALRAGYGGQLRLLVRKSADGAPAARLFNNLRRLGATERELGTLGHDFLPEAGLDAREERSTWTARPRALRWCDTSRRRSSAGSLIDSTEGRSAQRSFARWFPCHRARIQWLHLRRATARLPRLLRDPAHCRRHAHCYPEKIG